MPVIAEVAGTVGAHRPGDVPGHGIDLLDRRAERDRILLESWGNFRKGIPSWASTRTKDYQYVEYYGRRGRRIFREFYDLQNDPWELSNLLADGDPTNDPPTAELSAQLAAERACSGTDGPGACP